MTFSVTPPPSARNARFTCKIETFVFIGDSVKRHQEVLTERKPSAQVDRGIRKSLLPRISQHELLGYLERLGQNLLHGATTAEFTFKDYGPDDPRNLSGTKAKFLIRAKNHAVDEFNRLRRLREQLDNGTMI